MEVEDLQSLITPITKYSCRLCDAVFDTNQDVLRHIRQVHVVTDKVKEPVNTAQVADSQQAAVHVLDSNGAISRQNGTNVICETPSAFTDNGDNDDDDMKPTRELYLCGHCGNGYDSIADCRQHIMNDHNVSGFTHEITTEIDESPSATTIDGNKVSVGTQVMLSKKPGRKRKFKPDGEIYLMPPKKPKIPKRVEEPAPGKRKIRPPKTFQEDYCMAGRKHYTSRTSIVNDYKLHCTKPGCKATFKTKSSLDTHLACHVDGSDANRGFRCTQCSAAFNQWRTVRMHMWKSHEVDLDLLKCCECGFKTCTVAQLLRHEDAHDSDRPHTCNLCGKSFRFGKQLENHKMLHMQNNDGVDLSEHWLNKTDCNICDRDFTTERCLKRHMEAVHSKVRPFSCIYCGYKAPRKGLMRLHLRTHTGEKPFKCEMCYYSTGDHNSLRRHKMRHTGQRPYKCQYCSYACIQSISLKTHIKNKHPGCCEGVFTCNLCAFRSINRQSYLQHMKQHKTKPPSEEAELVEESHPPLGSVVGQVININQTSTDLQTTQLLCAALNMLSANHKKEKDNKIVPVAVQPNAVGIKPVALETVNNGTPTQTVTLQIASGQEGATDTDGNPVMFTVQAANLVPGETVLQDGATMVYTENNSEVTCAQLQSTMEEQVVTTHSETNQLP